MYNLSKQAKTTASKIAKKPYFEAYELADKLAIEIDQDWEREETIYYFEDSSALIDDGFKFTVKP